MMQIYIQGRGKNMNPGRKKKTGAALALVMMAFAVLSILGVTLLSLSLSETRQVIRQENNMKAFYAARSGADAMAKYLMDNPSQVNTIISKTSSTPGKGSFNGVEFEVKLINGLQPGELIIQSKGRARGMAEANVTLTLLKTTSVAFKQTIFTDGPMDLGNNTIVTGDIGTNTPDEIGFGNSRTKLNGNLFLGPEAVQDASGKYVGIDYGNINGTVSKQDRELVFPSIDESKFTEGYPDITNSMASPLIFYVEGQKRYIKINKIDLAGDKSVIVRGKGELHILAASYLDMSGSSSIQTEDGAKLFIYYKGTQDINIRGGSRFEGAIYSPNAAVEWTGGGNEIIKGAIMAKSFRGASSNTQIIFDESLNNMTFPLVGTEGYKVKEWVK